MGLYAPPKANVKPVSFQASNRHLTSRYLDVPTGAQYSMDRWHQGMGASAWKSGGDQVQIAALIDSYHQARTKIARAFVLGKLFWAMDDWLRVALRADSAGRRSSVEDDLYRVVVIKLCEFFKVSVNVLPNKLSAVWRKMDHHYDAEDRRGYLTDAQREKFRLHFGNGQIKRWKDDNLVLANTADGDISSNAIAPGIDNACLLEAGYVFSIWDRFYMRKHDLPDDPNDPLDPIILQAHSQYMAGGPVACAGEMTIQRGVLIAISNLSGHYKPHAKSLLPMLWRLNMDGINLGAVDVIVRHRDEHNQNEVFKCRAMDFLVAGGKPKNVQQTWPIAP